jgi:hypothetical protein
VTIEDEARGKIFDFPCHRWFAKDEDDRQITRELLCVNGSQQADMYITPGSLNISFFNEGSHANHNMFYSQVYHTPFT